MKNYSEFCKEQAEKLFAIIDQHDGLMEWRKTWKVDVSEGLPRGVGGVYQGMNIWALLNAQLKSGFHSSLWLTFNQVKQRGGHVLKGERGETVCFFKMQDIEDAEASGVDGGKKRVPVYRQYKVFNLDQTSLASQLDVADVKPVILPETGIMPLLIAVGARVSEFGCRALYRSSTDMIVMPRREYFESEGEYDATLLHELVHWSGHPSRLNRPTLNRKRDDRKARAEEELVAEIGAVFLSAHFGVRGDLVNHASYVADWKKHLDVQAISHAISQASKAFIWLIRHLEGEGIEEAA